MGWLTDTGNWFSDRWDDTADALGDLHNGITGKTQARAARSAAELQAKSAADANAEAKRQFDLTREDQAPWLNIGKKNLGRLDEMMGSGAFDMADPGSYNPGEFNYGEFNPSNLENDPGYKFRLAQGIKAIQNTRAGTGSLRSGSTLKALTNYGQGLASDEMANAYGRYADSRNFARSNYESNRNFGAGQFQQNYANRYANNADRFNRLAQIAGVGQSSAQNLAAHGANYANAYGSNVMSGANAQAAGQVGAANAQTNGMNNLLNLGAMLYAAA